MAGQRDKDFEEADTLAQLFVDTELRQQLR